MTKGAETRGVIVDEALRQASVMGLRGLSLGDLAAALSLSKSGLFAHFKSKENLQVEVIQRAKERFIEVVMMPAIREPRGEPRVRAMFERWLKWGLGNELPGGCIFISAASELDDQPGPVRDALVQTQRDWLGALAHAVRISIEEGHFRKDLDPEQFAFEMYALMLGCHHHSRLLKDARSIKRTRVALETLLSTAR
jgi:AcrR family transcriptional regulator